MALMATPVLSLFPATTNRWLAGTLLFFALLWMLSFRAYGRRRFGQTTLSREERFRQRFPSKIIVLIVIVFTAGQGLSRWYFHVHNSDWYLSMVIVTWLLSRVLDATNLVERRIAYGVGLAISIGLYGWLVLLASSDNAGRMLALPLSAFGSVLLSLSLLDFHLLCRTAAGGGQNV